MTSGDAFQPKLFCGHVVLSEHLCYSFYSVWLQNKCDRFFPYFGSIFIMRHPSTG